MPSPFANIVVFAPTLTVSPQSPAYEPTGADPLLTIEQAAAELNIHPRSVRRIVKEGGLKRDKVLGRIRLSAIRAYATN
jgi:excisionase family DNA binding protein